MPKSRIEVLSSHLHPAAVQSTPMTNLHPHPTSGWILVAHDGYENLSASSSLKGKTVFITGGSRGIGLAIGIRCAQDGANVVLAAKTTEEQPNLEGTIFTAAEKIVKAGGEALPVKCDVRDEKSVEEAVRLCVERFGGIDVLINNASAISLTGTLETTMKKFDLMHGVDSRATFMTTLKCLPFLLESAKKNRNPHVLTISPPLDMSPKWFKDNTAYAMAKYGMSMCTLGMSAEFKGRVAFNSLWPRTAIATAAVQNLLGGDGIVSLSRNAECMSDAAYNILCSNAQKCTGEFFIDDAVHASLGMTLKEMEEKYNVVKGTHSGDLAPDFFV